MTTAPECLHCDAFAASIETADARARTALTDAKAGRFDAVVWLSAHLAASAHVVHPAVARRVPGADAALAELRAADHRLMHVLRTVEQLNAGDAHAPRVGRDELRADLVAALDAHVAAEHELLHRLGRAIEPAEAADMASAYERALRRAPTRPHPHSPRRGLLGAVVYGVQRTRDHVLDVMDSRRVPLQRRG